jgi:hypothetical protein
LPRNGGRRHESEMQSFTRHAGFKKTGALQKRECVRINDR